MVNLVNSLANFMQNSAKKVSTQKGSGGEGFNLDAAFDKSAKTSNDPNSIRTSQPTQGNGQGNFTSSKPLNDANVPTLDPTDDDIIVSSAASMSVLQMLAQIVPTMEEAPDPQFVVDTVSQMVTELNLDHDPKLQDILQQLQKLVPQNHIDSPQEARTPQDNSQFDNALQDVVGTIKGLLQEDPASLYIILDKEPFINLKPLFVENDDTNINLVTDTPEVPVIPQMVATSVQTEQADNGNDEKDSQSSQQGTDSAVQNALPLTQTFAERLPDAIAPPAEQQNIEAFRSSIMEQAIAQVTSTVQSGQQTMTIQLRPEFLGNMTLQLMMTQQGLTARMSTSDPQVQAMMAEQLTQLQLQLQERGINVVHMEVIYNQMADSRFQQNPSSQDTQQYQPSSRPHSFAFNSDITQNSVSMYDTIADAFGGGNADATPAQDQVSIDYLA